MLVYLGVALGFSFLCSVFEAVFLSVTPAFVGKMGESKPKVAAIWRELKSAPSRALSAILILNTVAHTVGAAGVGAQAAKVFQSVPFAVIGAVLTILILIISEIIPKTLGATYWRPWAGWVGICLRWMKKILLPFVWISEKITSIFGKGHVHGSFNREEFAAMVEIGRGEGELTDGEARILTNIFHARSTKVGDSMTPRTVVFAIQESTSAADFLRQSKNKPFSRIPIYGQNRDDITGFVLKSEVALGVADKGEKTLLSKFARQIHSIPEQTSLLETLDHFIKERQHIALVVDEYGAAGGIVSLEDVVETLLGMEIVDESDKSVDMQVLARELWKKRAESMGISDADFAESGE